VHAVFHALYTLKYANIDLEIEVIGMPRKKKKVEGAVEKTGEAVGKGLKKGAKAVNDFARALLDAICVRARSPRFFSSFRRYNKKD
jgi:hypothetical protein